jgi:hypothetical protein
MTTKWPTYEVGDIITYQINGWRCDFRVSEVISDHEVRMTQVDPGRPGWRPVE